MLLVHQDLAQAVAALVLGHKAAGIAHGQLLDLVIDALRLRFFLGQAAGGDFRLGVDDGRVGVIAHDVLLAQDGVDAYLGLAVGGVSQHDVAVAVACGEHAVDVGAALRVHDDAGAVGLDADVLKADALNVGAAADGEQHLVGRDFDLLAVGRFGDDLALFDGQALVAQQEGDALLFQLLLEQRADFAVGRAGDVIEHLDHGDLRARGGVIGDHFQTDDAAADDDEVLRHLGQLEHLAVGDDEAADVLAHAGDGRNDRGGAGADNHLRALVVLAAGGHAEAAFHAALDDGVFLDDGHARALHLRAHAGDQRLDDLAAARDDGLLVELRALDGHAVFVGMERVLIELGGVEQRLGGNAAFVQAHAAQRVFLKQDDLEARMARALGGQIAGRAAADDDQIKHWQVPSFNKRYKSVSDGQSDGGKRERTPRFPPKER